jgi:Flp pilus assembly protein TadB
MALTGERTEAMREDARNMRESVRKENIEGKLEEVVKERPGVRPFLEFRPLLIAVGIALVLTLIALLLASPAVAGIVLVLSFALAWVVMSRREYAQRQPTKDADDEDAEDDDSPGKGDEEVAPYSS